MGDVVVTISEKSLGIAILARDGVVTGIITDGDLRRNISRLWAVTPREVATSSPLRIQSGALATEAVALMAERGVTACLVDNPAGTLIGLVHLHDCVRAGATQ
jgi:arabinose-5-phosphate isomerase